MVNGWRLVAAAVVALCLVADADEVSAVQGAQPYLQLAPSSVAPGAEVRAFGSGFCASPGCSRVTLDIQEENASAGSGKTLASHIAVGGDGRFTASFTADAPGRYTVSARQMGDAGGSLVATATLLVQVIDYRPGETTTTTTQVAVSPTVPASATTTATTSTTSVTTTSATTTKAAPTSGSTSVTTARVPSSASEPVSAGSATTDGSSAEPSALDASPAASEGDDGSGSRLALPLLAVLAAAVTAGTFVVRARRTARDRQPPKNP